MTTYRFFGVLTEVDEAATRAWYARASEWECACGNCRNFLAVAAEKRLPAPALEALAVLGIPAEKATYVGELYPTETGNCYQFSYRIAGNIQGTEAVARYSWGTGGCTHVPYPYGAPDFPAPHFDLEFSVELPWILDEPRNA